MITMYAIYDDKIVNKKFYKNNTQQTRDHYISTLRRFYQGKYDILDTITFYRNDFVFKNKMPYDDFFTIVIEEQFLDGHLYNDTFFSYNFDVNSGVNLTILFTDDSYTNRKIFVEEIMFYLRNFQYYDIMQKYQKMINDFLYSDNEIVFVEEHKLAMRKEDD